MKLENVRDVVPMKDGVLVNVLEATKEDGGVFLGEVKSEPTDIKMYFGIVEKVGPDATEDVNCPGLKAGDIGFFSEFSGHHISTREKTMHKLIPAYDIMAIVTDTKELNETTVQPTADRLLVEVMFVDQDQNGIILSDKESKDPKLKDLDYGKILSIGPVSKQGLKIGQTVAYEPYSGERIRREAGVKQPELRLIRENDILFIIK